MKKTKIILPIFLFAVMFLLGSTSVVAQYVNSDEALIILKDEITAETVIVNSPNSDNATKERSAFRIKYYSSIMANIEEGLEVGGAIEESEPSNMPRIQNSGMIAFDNGGNFKLEKEVLLIHTEDILTH